MRVTVIMQLKSVEMGSVSPSKTEAPKVSGSNPASKRGAGTPSIWARMQAHNSSIVHKGTHARSPIGCDKPAAIMGYDTELEASNTTPAQYDGGITTVWGVRAAVACTAVCHWPRRRPTPELLAVPALGADGRPCHSLYHAIRRKNDSRRPALCRAPRLWHSPLHVHRAVQAIIL